MLHFSIQFNKSFKHFSDLFLQTVFFFFCIWEWKNKWGEIYTSLLATQVRFAHLLRSQGDKSFKHFSNLFLQTVVLQVPLQLQPDREHSMAQISTLSVRLHKNKGICMCRLESMRNNCYSNIVRWSVVNNPVKLLLKINFLNLWFFPM